MQPVFRFAPSPNGFLHLGHAFSALLNAKLAREAGGILLLRIEDIDTARCTEGLVSACLEDLAWLGIEWHGPVLQQSTQFPRYRAAAEGLKAQGLLYPCFCTRADLVRAGQGQKGQKRAPDGAPLYPGTCRALAPGEVAQRLARGDAHALRLDMGKALKRLGASGLSCDWVEQGSGQEAVIRAAPERWGDVVLVRKDCPASYHLAVVLDDAMQGVSHVVRGRDLYAATGIHRALQGVLGLPAPLYHHHALIEDEAGRKLGKSIASRSLRAMRAEGVSAAAIRQSLGFIPP